MRPSLIVLGTALGLTASGAMVAGAQHLDLRSGTKVRVSAPTLDILDKKGSLIHATSESLTVAFRGRTEPMTIPRDALTRLAMSTGRNRTVGVLRGAVTGVIGGALLGAGIGAWASDSCGRLDCWAAGAITGSWTGLVIGGITGAAIAPERWKEVQPPSLTPGARVRLAAPDLGGTRLVGTLVGARNDTLLVELSRRGAVSVPTARLSSLDVSTDRSRVGGAFRGAGIGFATGVLLMTALGLVADASECLEYLCVSLFSAYAGGIGGLVGAAVGAVAPPDRWVNVPLHVQTGGRAKPDVNAPVRLGVTYSF